MPSDPRVDRVLELLESSVGLYRGAVATTLEEIRGYLRGGRSDAETRGKRLQEQLGAFAGDRVDAIRLASLVADRHSLNMQAIERLERTADVLHVLLERGDELFRIAVPPGGDPAAHVSTQLAVVGRAFAAGRVAASARHGIASALDERAALDGFPFGLWNTAERHLAPPLVVTVHGPDLVAGALAPFLDGAQKVVLIVEGQCAPAPLVRLITPGVLVIQAHDLQDLGMLAPWRDAALAALVPLSAVRFVHDPSAGPEPWQRMSVHAARDSRTARLGSLSSEQQAEELRQLEALATHAPLADAISASRPSRAAADSADRLAAWLLHQADLPVAPPAD